MFSLKIIMRNIETKYENLKEFNLHECGELVSVGALSDKTAALIFKNKRVVIGLEESDEGLELVSYIDILDTSSDDDGLGVFLADVDMCTSGVYLTFTDGSTRSVEINYNGGNPEDDYATENYSISIIV